MHGSSTIQFALLNHVVPLVALYNAASAIRFCGVGTPVGLAEGSIVADGEGVVGAEVGGSEGSGVGAGLEVGTGVGPGVGHAVPKLFPASTAQKVAPAATI